MQNANEKDITERSKATLVESGRWPCTCCEVAAALAFQSESCHVVELCRICLMRARVQHVNERTKQTARLGRKAQP